MHTNVSDIFHICLFKINAANYRRCLHKCQLSRYTKTNTNCYKLEFTSKSRGGREVYFNPIIEVKTTNLSDCVGDGLTTSTDTEYYCWPVLSPVGVASELRPPSAREEEM